VTSRAAIWIVLFAGLQLAVVASAQPTAPAPPAPTPAPALEQPPPTPPVEPSGAPASTVSAPAEQAPASSAGSGAQQPPAATSVAGFDLLVAAGYGQSTENPYGNELEPYGATFGIDAGYTWSFGLRLGAYLDYGLGRALTQERMPLIGRDNELKTDAWSLSTGLALGHDLSLRFLILRYSWSFGMTWLNWDFDTSSRSLIRGYPSMKGSSFGFHMAPGLAVLWPFGRFTCGVGFDYFIQVKDQIPLGILSKLLVGVKL